MSVEATDKVVSKIFVKGVDFGTSSFSGGNLKITFEKATCILQYRTEKNGWQNMGAKFNVPEGDRVEVDMPQTIPDDAAGRNSGGCVLRILGDFSYVRMDSSGRNGQPYIEHLDNVEGYKVDYDPKSIESATYLIKRDGVYVKIRLE